MYQWVSVVRTADESHEGRRPLSHVSLDGSVYKVSVRVRVSEFLCAVVITVSSPVGVIHQFHHGQIKMARVQPGSLPSLFLSLSHPQPLLKLSFNFFCSVITTSSPLCVSLFLCLSTLCVSFLISFLLTCPPFHNLASFLV